MKTQDTEHKEGKYRGTLLRMYANQMKVRVYFAFKRCKFPYGCS